MTKAPEKPNLLTFYRKIRIGDCPVCNTEGAVAKHETYCKCRKCGMVFLSPESVAPNSKSHYKGYSP